MRKSRKEPVQNQSLREINGNTESYERYISEFPANRNAYNKSPEPPQANPDSLQDQPHRPSTPQLLMGEAIAHLQGRQKQVYLLHMREDQSLSEVGEALNISKSAAQIYLNRAVAFITAYCKQAIDGGRV